MAVGKQISSFMSTCPFKYQNYPDGNGGSIVKLDLSTSLSTPSYSNSVSNSSYTFTPTYSGVNVDKNSTTTTYSTPSQTYNNGYFIALKVNSAGYIYDLEYSLSPNMAKGTYESYLQWKSGGK